MKKRWGILIVVGVVALVLIPTVQAVTVSGLVIEFRCDGMYVPYDYVITWNRDNTGAGQENARIEVWDGYGRLIYWEDSAQPLGTMNRTGGFFISYHKAPQANPITFQWFSKAGNGLPQQVAMSTFGECPGLPWAPPEAEPVPTGFAQRMILCDVPIYDEPAGHPVGDNRVTMYQNWHVNLTPVMGPDGQLWTEIFVSGPYTGYIPTACVQ